MSGGQSIYCRLGLALDMVLFSYTVQVLLVDYTYLWLWVLITGIAQSHLFFSTVVLRL